MGALNPERLAEFIDRYRSFDDPDIPGFMYGSHYSTAVGVVLHYLVRLQPFADLHREMQVRSFVLKFVTLPYFTVRIQSCDMITTTDTWYGFSFPCLLFSVLCSSNT